MHRSRAVALAGTVSAVAVLFLPFARLGPRGAFNGFAADAWPVLLLIVPGLLVLVLGDPREAPVLPVAVLGLGLSLAGCAFAVAKLIDARSAAAAVEGSVGTGAWLLPVATAVVAAGAVLGMNRRV